MPVDRLRRELLVQEREAAEAAVADDLERHPLMDGARRARIDEEREVGVTVDVDEAGGDDLAGGVDLLGRLGHGSDRHDPTSAQADVGQDRLGSGAVDDEAVADCDFDAHGLSSRRQWPRRRRRRPAITTP